MTLTLSPRRQYVEFRGDGSRLPHLPGLDGLRGVAVAGVVLFHTDLGFMRGGYLGVSTFFTLSGFLITSLLLRETAETDTVHLRGFWRRRVQRLLPASVVTLFLVATLFAWLVATPEQLDSLGGDTLASVFNVANWHLILSGTSYGDLFAAPSPLVHFWSLAIEEQFYLLFPLLLLGLWRATRRSAPLLGAALGVLAVASAVEPLVVDMSPDRIYFGTDTRAAELLLGGVLAVLLTRRGLRRRLAYPSAARTGVLAAGAVLGAVQLYLWVTLEQSSPVLYEGGFAVYALMTCVVIVAASLPSGPMRAALSSAPLAWLGARSYAIYLVHWPLLLAARQTFPESSPVLVAVGGVAVSLLVAELSFRYLERPIRSGRSPVSRHLVVSAVAAIGVVSVVALLLPTNTADPEGQLDFDRAFDDQAELLEEQAERAEAAGTAPTTAPAPPPEEGEPAPPPEPPTPKLATFGDSTALLMGLGMLEWAVESGRVIGAPGDATLGCGVARFESRRVDQEFGYTEECTAWPTRWEAAIEEQQPNIAQLITGSWEVTDALVPGSETWAAIGDPVVDDFIRSELLTAVDILGADGAMVLLVLWPRIADHVAVGASPGERAKSDPARWARLHEIMREVAEQRPDTVRILDLQAMLADRIEDTTLRPDGIHIPAAQVNALYEGVLGDETLRLWEEFWRSKYEALRSGGTTR